MNSPVRFLVSHGFTLTLLIENLLLSLCLLLPWMFTNSVHIEHTNHEWYVNYEADVALLPPPNLYKFLPSPLISTTNIALKIRQTFSKGLHMYELSCLHGYSLLNLMLHQPFPIEEPSMLFQSISAVSIPSSLLKLILCTLVLCNLLFDQLPCALLHD